VDTLVSGRIDRSDRRASVRYMVAAMMSLILATATCLAVQPHADTVTHGVSIYGNHWPSAAPYAAGLLASALFTALATNRLPWSEHRLRSCLRATSFLFVAVLATPSSFSPLIGVLHLSFGGGLFFCQLLVGVHLRARMAASRLLRTLFAIQCAGSFLMLLSLMHAVSMMFVAQVATELAFGALLIVGTARALSPSPPPPESGGGPVRHADSRLD
jgi:hypothetical protein